MTNERLKRAGGRPEVKCLVWDLDRTLWTGVLSEGDDVRLRDGVRATIERLDGRGILQSVASRNDPDQAMAKLAELGLDHFMVEPQISWGTKSAAITTIAARLNIGVDTLAFVDDDPFEREEVASVAPEVLCVPAEDVATLADRAEFSPAVISEDAHLRRRRYQEAAQRDRFEADFSGPSITFLSSLALRLTISLAEPDDLLRAEELTLRTNQLNATGRPFSQAELAALLERPDKVLAIVSLSDRFGDYGRIGLCLVDWSTDRWLVELVLFSCRVLSRGVTGVFLSWLAAAARENGTPLLAEFRASDRNRAMLIAYRFAGFEPTTQGSEADILRHAPEKLVAIPDYFHVEVEPALADLLRPTKAGAPC